MNPTIPHKKASLSSKKQRQSIMRRQRKIQHDRNNSMIDALTIKGSQRQSQMQRKNNNQTKPEQQESMQQFIDNEFKEMSKRIKHYCQKINNKLSKIQKTNRQKNNTQSKQQQQQIKQITEEQVFNLIMNKIKQFMKQNQLQNFQLVSPNKIQFLSSNSHSININDSRHISGNSRNIGRLLLGGDSINIGSKSKQLNKIQNVEVYNINNPKKYSSITLNQNSTPKNSQIPQIKQNNTCNKFYAPNFINSIPISCSSTISQILYKQARNRSFKQFNSFYEKIILQKKPVISDYHYFKKQKIQTTNFYLNQIYKKINLINTKLSYAATGQIKLVKKDKQVGEDKTNKLGQQIDQICVVLKKLNQIHNLNSLIFDCSRPCCKVQRQSPQPSTKAKILLNLKQAAKKSLHYKTQITDQYWNRYYNKQSFDKTRIYSVQKTKTQQMQELQKTYYRNKGNKKVCKKRCKSLFQNVNL